ncbi:oligodendrocyte-myelin glycoprotein [Notechis scutatus]|uniref:Oligodendrocyte-myelin glycoprotein n=1 Tax=Notechis scutatus TaxID=8663 RepID=A0A6J1UYZ0_9SAUR|nr:oligodendrocyte-myelin glycoprotein [Notechis scutatus]
METRILKATLGILALLVFIPAIQGICPSLCSCSGNDRNVDCSGRNLTTLPYGLQDNITYLNLSYNHFVDLNHQLTQFANLRTLDVSNNWLRSLPAQLPRSLWEIYATHNSIRVLQKLDTAYQWNLKVLDVSRNMVERAVLINNTMSSLVFLNLSSNKLWTVPTNIPIHVEIVDLSNNFLSQILHGTLRRLTHLSQLYLHNNKFTYIPDKAFDQLAQLQLITLYNNPWACKDKPPALSYLQNWVGKTQATIFGVPCPEEEKEEEVSWEGSGPFSATPTLAQNHLFVKAIKAVDTTDSAEATEQSELAYEQQSGMTDINVNSTDDPTIAFTSTDRPLVPYPQNLSTENLNSFEVAAATHRVYIQDTTSAKSRTKGLAEVPTIPMTLRITSGVPTNYPTKQQSTTTKKEERTTKMSPRAPSKANVPRGYLFSTVMLAVVALATGSEFVFK